jgi:hypothetical protein
MKTIFVHFWGYKSKELPEAVNALISNQSGQNKIVVSVYDQTNIAREEKFSSDFYQHVRWDRIESSYTFLNNSINSAETDYFMYVEGAVYFQPGWDLELVMGHAGRNVIISGNAGVHFQKESNFYPPYKSFESSTANITNWISHDFIFMDTNLFKMFPDISLLKYIGLEDVFSLYAAHLDIRVQSIPSAWCKRIDGGIFSIDYVPFSLKHNYNLVVDLYKEKQNVFFNDIFCVARLSNLVGFDFSTLSYLPYAHNDISYNPEMKIDNISAERFSQNIRSIG